MRCEKKPRAGSIVVHISPEKLQAKQKCAYMIHIPVGNTYARLCACMW
jgi:hypothetical protein